MKKLILAGAALFLSSGFSFAQTDSTGSKTGHDMNDNNHDRQNNTMNHDMDNHKMDPGMNPTMDKSHSDQVMMQNGKMMTMNHGKIIMMDHEMTMSNGTKVMTDGTYITKDGTKMMMKDGERMDMAGNVVKSNGNKDMYLVPDSTKNKVH